MKLIKEFNNTEMEVAIFVAKEVERERILMLIENSYKKGVLTPKEIKSVSEYGRIKEDKVKYLSEFIWHKIRVELKSKIKGEE